MAGQTAPGLPASQREGRPFNRRTLRGMMGPSNKIFHILESECIDSVLLFKDDFMGVLNTDYWTVSNSGGAGQSDFARSASVLDGIVRGDAGTTDDGDVRLFFTSNLVFLGNNRPVMLARVRMPSTVANSKFEVGFANAAGAGAALVKDTPTSTAADYAVIIRDTDDDTSVDLVTDGTTDAAGLVASSPGITFTTNTYYTLMLAINELRECYFWIDGVYQGVRRAGPDNDVAIGPWFYVQDRDDANNKQLDIDYVQLWQDRVGVL